MKFEGMRKLDVPLKLKQAVEGNSGGHKTIKGAKKTGFYLFGLILFCGCKELSEINV